MDEESLVQTGVRMPLALREKLHGMARAESTSFNQFCLEVLAAVADYALPSET